MRTWTAIPGGVLGWMCAWGIWPASTRATVPETAIGWLPSATGSTMHRVDPTTFDGTGALALCRSGAQPVNLVCKAPLSPGDIVERGSYFESPDDWPIWQAVGGALETLEHHAHEALSAEERDAYRTAAEAVVILGEISRGEISTCVLPRLGERWQRLTEPDRHLLPWLIVAGANGITRNCKRCRAEARITRPSVMPSHQTVSSSTEQTHLPVTVTTTITAHPD